MALAGPPRVVRLARGDCRDGGSRRLEPGRRINGGRLAQARRRMGWSQRELAAWWGRSESLVSKIEQGVKRLDSVDDARRLADLTGVDVVWLLGLDGAGSGWRPAQSPAGPPAGQTAAE